MKRLGVHLENEQQVYMFEGVPLPEALERAETTELLAFFKYNSNNPGTNIPYVNFPEKFMCKNKQE